MATYIKTVFTEKHLTQVLTAPESMAEKIIRLNPKHSNREILEALRRNTGVSPSTESYNLSTKIAVICFNSL